MLISTCNANNHTFALTFPGVKNADENELHSIASEPSDTHVYNVADFNIMSSIVEGLTRTVCEQVVQQDKDIKQSKETMRQRDCAAVKQSISSHVNSDYFGFS